MLRGQANDLALAFAAVLVALLLALARTASGSSIIRARCAGARARWSTSSHAASTGSRSLRHGWTTGSTAWSSGWRLLRRDGRRHVRTLGEASGYWAFDIACLTLVMLAFGQHVGVDALLIAYPVANVVGTFSPTPGGLGAVEGVLIGLLVGFGLEPGAAVAVVLVYRLINFWLPIPVGLVTYLSVR